MRALGEPNIAQSTVTSVAPSALSPVLSLSTLQVTFLPSYALGLMRAHFHHVHHSEFPSPIELWQERTQ